MQEKKSKTKTFAKLLFAFLFLVIGFAIGFFISSKKELPANFQQELQKLTVDSVQKIQDTIHEVLVEKEKAKFDSLKTLGNIRDSLLVHNGKITATMILILKKPDAYDQMDSLRYNINQFVSNCDQMIMNATLDLLQPTNTALRGLIKEIKTKTEKLKNIANSVATISDIVSTITAILSLPILAPVAAVGASS